jgi:hypothetical protein
VGTSVDFSFWMVVLFTIRVACQHLFFMAATYRLS